MLASFACMAISCGMQNPESEVPKWQLGGHFEWWDTLEAGSGYGVGLNGSYSLLMGFDLRLQATYFPDLGIKSGSADFRIAAYEFSAAVVWRPLDSERRRGVGHSDWSRLFSGLPSGPYIGAGVEGYFFDSEFQAPGSSMSASIDAVPAGLIVAGLNVNLTENLSVFAQLEYKFVFSTIRTTSGSAAIDLSGPAAVFGLCYQR